MLDHRGESWLVSQALNSRHGFSTRLGGESPEPHTSLNLGLSTGDATERVMRNRERACRSLELPSPIHLVHQVHGVEVLEVTRFPIQGAFADALWTREPGVTVGVLVADCTPILIEDRRNGTVAAIHAGWRGAVAGVAARTVQALVREAGSKVEDLVAVLGPGIGPCCFEVGDEVIESLKGVPDGPAGLWHVPNGKERAHMDVPGISIRHLSSAGVQDIHPSGLCTACDPVRFFSHRRDRGLTGRMVAAIACQIPR